MNVCFNRGYPSRGCKRHGHIRTPAAAQISIRGTSNPIRASNYKIRERHQSHHRHKRRKLVDWLDKLTDAKALLSCIPGLMTGRKRSRGEFEDGQHESRKQFALGQTLSLLRGEDAETSIYTDVTTSPEVESNSKDGWQKVASKRSLAKQRKRARIEAEQDDEKPKHPSITHSPQARLHTEVKLGDLQSLVLYLLADGTAPQWVAIRHQAKVRKVVVLLVPGLELGMCNGTVPLTNGTPDDSKHDQEKKTSSNGEKDLAKAVDDSSYRSPDDFYPRVLWEGELAQPLKPLADMFPHIWPVQAPGDSRMSKLWSPLGAILSVSLAKSQEEKQMKGVKPAREAKNWKNQPTPVSEYIASMTELLESDYVLHEALLHSDEEKRLQNNKRQRQSQTSEHGWRDTNSVPSSVDVSNLQQSSSSVEVSTNASCERAQQTTNQSSDDQFTKGRQVFAIDCEMCQTGPGCFELTRISVLDWSGSVVFDTLVKPDNPITDYLTPYSGITAEKLDPITTKLSDVQDRLVALMKPDAILLGHSFNSDLAALKLVHPYILDTTILYPHPGGDHLKQSLKWLTQKYLDRDIQKGANGHNSVEDARAALDLVKLKCQRGPKWGTSEATLESIFKRLGRVSRGAGAQSEMRKSALVDWGFPKRGHGGVADVCFGCDSDDQVVQGVRRAVNGDEDGREVPGGGVDFVWARMRELEATRGWWSASKTADNDVLRDKVTAGGNDLSDAVGATVARIRQIYEELPPCTAFIVYSGTGDPRELTRLHAMHQKFRDEYKVKKWDELSVKWTDMEEQALQKAFKTARMGCGFITVK